MSEAQSETYATKKKEILLNNDQVYDALRKMQPDMAEPKATVEQVIGFITGGRTMSAVEGKRVSQPVYRAMSEGAQEGILDDSESITNLETGSPNTVYRLLRVKKPARGKDATWKMRALQAEEEIAELKIQLETCRSSIDRLQARLDD